MKLRQDFCILTAVYTKSYHSEKSLKAVNNTPATEIWQLLTCENYQTICVPYYWDKQHANINPLILMTDWLIPMHSSQKTTFQFLNVFNVHTSILSAKTIFMWYFWIVPNTFNIYFWEGSRWSQNKHLFLNMFETA